MPAPKSILTEKPKPYAPVTNAIAIYEKTLHICLKMPKRYTYLILQDVIRLAGEVMDNTKKANSVFAQNLHEAQIRKDFWINARASLQALSLSPKGVVGETQLLPFLIGVQHEKLYSFYNRFYIFYNNRMYFPRS